MSVPIDPLSSLLLPPRGAPLEAPKSIRETMPVGLPESLKLVLVRDDLSAPSAAWELAKRLGAAVATISNLQRQLAAPNSPSLLRETARDFRALSNSLSRCLSENEHPLRNQLRTEQLLTVGHVSGFSFADLAIRWMLAVDRELQTGIYMDAEARRAKRFGHERMIDPNAFSDLVTDCWSSIVCSWRLRWIDCETLLTGLRMEERRSTPLKSPKASGSHSKASALDLRRWKFAKPLRQKKPAVPWKKIAQTWCDKRKDVVDADAFRQSCHRAEKSEK